MASLLAKVNWRRRRSRLVTRTLAAAAAAAMVVGVLVAVQFKPGAPVAVPPPAARLCPLETWDAMVEEMETVLRAR
ncbi:hypothetical protein [Mycobacterium sp. JS623]|uniref:hypothetical protein n=1 Tax=Mycobacterium sp. JS623 TaxID=212767 RepID=UPI0003087764